MSESPSIFYEPQELAQIIVNYNMDSNQSKAFINNIWKNESKYLYPDYQEDLEQLRDDIMEACKGKHPFQPYNDEYPEISFDIKKAHKNWDRPQYHDIRFFLINLRLRILYLQKAPDVRTNMKLLLKKYGYRRRNATMVHFMETTLDALDLKVTDRHKLRCDLGKVKLEDIIIFQAKRHEPVIKTEWDLYNEKFHDGNLFFRQRYTTYDIEQAVERMRSFEEFEAFYNETLIDGNSLFPDYLDQLLKKYGANASSIAVDVGVSAGHMRKIAAGQVEQPGRDLILAICTVLQTTVEEAQILLRYSGNRALYARDKRDALIWFALKKQISSQMLELHLMEQELAPLIKP